MELCHTWKLHGDVNTFVLILDRFHIKLQSILSHIKKHIYPTKIRFPKIVLDSASAGQLDIAFRLS